MPTRWIVFRVINYLVIVSIALQVIIVLYSIMQTRTNNWIFSSLFFCSVGILFANCIFNIIWLERYYPEHTPSAIFKRSSLIFFILAILVLALFIFALSLLYYEFYLGEELFWSLSWQAMLSFLLLNFIAIAGIYIIIYRISLIRLIQHNQRRQFTDFLETQN